MDDKEISNIAHDKQRNSDLAMLTGQGEPFTKPKQVEESLKNPDMDVIIKSKRLYVEVRHARNSCKESLYCGVLVCHQSLNLPQQDHLHCQPLNLPQQDHLHCQHAVSGSSWLGLLS